MGSYEEYEQACNETMKQNQVLLSGFAESLAAAGLSKKTIRNHVDNADLYINDFLLREDAVLPEDGLGYLDSFFTFFIHKCMWSTPAAVKSTAASLKKLYKYMMEQGRISAEDYKEFARDLKEGVPFWQSECSDYNNDDNMWW